jgi:hypothetical protein
MLIRSWQLNSARIKSRKLWTSVGRGYFEKRSWLHPPIGQRKYDRQPIGSEIEGKK